MGRVGIRRCPHLIHAAAVRMSAEQVCPLPREFTTWYAESMDRDEHAINNTTVIEELARILVDHAEDTLTEEPSRP